MATTWGVVIGPGQDLAHTRTQAHTHTQMETHCEVLGDGHAYYWFAQINDSQPGHLI